MGSPNLMRVLVACEYSGIVRDAFLARGHDAVSCDLLPTESPGPHIQADVRPLLRQPWDLVIAHPPCQYLSNARTPWINRDPLWHEHTAEGAELFNACLAANAPRVCVENPQMHGDAIALCGPASQRIEPWHFGDPWLKRTLLWLRGLPPLLATKHVTPTHRAVCNDPKDRTDIYGKHSSAKDRSRFWPGIAAAMADQWGGE